MKNPAIVLLLLLGLAACRGGDPDQAPPIGHASDTPAPARAPLSVNAVSALPPLPGLDAEERSRRYRRASADARNELDAAWNRCGSLEGEPFVRCRDEAVVLYDQAMVRARAQYGEDVDDRSVLAPGTLDNPGEIVAIQLTGIRG